AARIGLDLRVRIMERPPMVFPPPAFPPAAPFRGDLFQASAEGGLRPLLSWGFLFSAPSGRYIGRYRSGDYTGRPRKSGPAGRWSARPEARVVPGCFRTRRKKGGASHPDRKSAP